MDESEIAELSHRQRPAKVAMHVMWLLTAAVAFFQSRKLLPPQFVSGFAIAYLLALVAIIAFVIWTRVSRRPPTDSLT